MPFCDEISFLKARLPSVPLLIERASPTRLLLGLIAFCALTRVALGITLVGFLTGDDVEMLEAAFRSAGILEYQPWAIRNLLVPHFLLGPLLRFCALLGLTDARWLVVAATLPFVAASLANIFFVHKLAAALLESSRGALVAAFLYSFHWLPMGFGSTVYPRTLSTACILGGALLVLPRPGRLSLWRPFFAGGLVALAGTARFSEVVYLAPLVLALLVWWPAGRRSAALCGTLVGFAVGSFLFFGLVDAATWGRPFASLVAFARYTLLERQSSSRVATQPVAWYIQNLHRWLPLTMLPGIWAARAERKLTPIFGFVVLPLLVFSAVHHKELRYLQGVVPFLAILCGCGFLFLRRRGRLALTTTLVVLSVLWGALGMRFLGRKSLPAVAAARHLARSNGSVVFLSQAWAYGDRIFLSHLKEIRDIPPNPSKETLALAIQGADQIALYRTDVRQNPELAAILCAKRFRLVSEYGGLVGRAVLVFERAVSGAES
ncbi:MAG TPA: hypothetical protein P5234_02355 [Thermoanaerobaculaceae bacterium]|nr:hypothetical protein [Thermoanaerobaculaceae bacterium]HRS15069.1 hypothetical protein [Thermoanaerobaculaceae bacterium]